MKNRTTREWMDLLEPAEIMCAPVNNIAQVVEDPHIRERGMVVEVEHSRRGKLRVVGTPMKFSRTPCQIDKASPDLSAQKEEILKGLLGMSSEEIEEMRKQKAV